MVKMSLDAIEYLLPSNESSLDFPNTSPPFTASSSSSFSDINLFSRSFEGTATTSTPTNRPTTTKSRRGSELPFWLIPCYGIIFLFAIVGNLLVISTLIQNRRMRTITNVFLLNLAISDLLLGVLCMPVTLVGTLLRHFIFGEYFCKLIQFSQGKSVRTQHQNHSHCWWSYVFSFSIRNQIDFAAVRSLWVDFDK